MKIECEIADIKREEVVEAMAAQLLGVWAEEYSEEEGPSSYVRSTPLGEALKKAVLARVETLAEELATEHFEETIKARIGQAVDTCLAEGWQPTDSYGKAKGERLDLKGRISEVITEEKSSGYGKPKRTLAANMVIEAVENVFRGDFAKEIGAAREALRDKLTAGISDKFAETVKSALGVR